MSSIFNGSHCTLRRPVHTWNRRFTIALVRRQARPPTPQTCNLETCVRSRELLVREIGEFVKTQFEREILTTNEGCLH